MIDGLRPYPETKPSGLPWLGDVPAHWEVRRNGRLFAARRETGFPDLPILEVSIRSGVRIRDFDKGGRKQEMANRSKYQRAVRGDIAYNMMRMWQGAVGIAPTDGLVSPAYVVARPFPETDPAYYAYLFRTATYMREIAVFSRGIVPDRNRLYWESFKQIPSVYPPLEEQRLIVRFLDWHAAHTAKLIRAKKMLIALLNEQKQAVIHHAVTRGLDPSTKLKPSGIPWLGDIPEHWEVHRLKRVCRVQGGYAFRSSTFGDAGIPVVRMNNLRRGILNLSEVARIAEDEIVQGFDLKSGDILYGLSGSIGATGSLGNYAVVAERDLPALLNQRVARFVPRLDRIDSNFLIQLIQTSIFYEQVLADTTGTAQFNVSTGDIENVTFALPSVGEQKRIVSRIEENNGALINTIARLEREVELLREYRTRLVGDAVTGNFDVREVAVDLPEITEAEPIGEDFEDDTFEPEQIDEDENEEVAA